MNSDEQLILEFQKGSRDAFREIFERYREPLYGFFRRRLDNPARAEELDAGVLSRPDSECDALRTAREFSQLPVRNCDQSRVSGVAQIGPRS